MVASASTGTGLGDRSLSEQRGNRASPLRVAKAGDGEDVSLARAGACGFDGLFEGVHHGRIGRCRCAGALAACCALRTTR